VTETLSRREFLKAGVISGIAVLISQPGRPLLAGALFEDQRRRPPVLDGASGALRHRTDGVAKVCGEKVFAYDVRARDLPGWPAEQSHAMLLRATLADRVYEGIDLSALGGELGPDRVVTAEDLARDGLALPPFYGEDMLVPAGKRPAIPRRSSTTRAPRITAPSGRWSS